MARKRALDQFLQARFEAKHAAAMIRHFVAMTSQYQASRWEDTIQAGGKFVEATIKAIAVRAGLTLPRARQFKVSTTITAIGNKPAADLDDALRITVPRACEFMYDIASNRGARHDPDQVDPNEIDAAAIIATGSWVMAEMIRYAQSGAAGTSDVTSILSGLAQRRYPQLEEVDGRVYFHLPGLSARELALLTLWYFHPKRILKNDLFNILVSRKILPDNARKAIDRLALVVDEDSRGLRLLQPGLAEAEGLFARSRNS